MNKKYLGLIIGILLIGGVTALVINYYSNLATVHIGNMNQPLHITYWNGTSYQESPLELGGGVAGSTITTYARMANIANNPIPTNLNIIVNDTLLDVTCLDVTNMTVDGSDVTASCTENAGEITFIAPKISVVGNNDYRLDSTFNPGAVGDYSLSVQAKL